MTLDELRQSGRATISVEQAARVLGVSRGVAYQAARDGQIPALRLGHRLLVPTAGLLRLLESGGEGGQ